MKFVLIALIWCAPAFAQQLEVHQFNRDLPKSERNDFAPDPKERNRLLASAGLDKQVTNWDHFAKDLLYIRAADLPLERLKKYYPELEPGALSRFQKLVREK